MKKVIVLLAVLAALMVAAVSMAADWDRLSVRQLTVTGSIKNANGTNFTGATLPLSGGTMTGAIKAKVPGNAFSTVTTSGIQNSGVMTGKGTATFGNTTTGGINNGKLFLNGHTFTVMTSTINGINRNLLYY